MAVRGRPRVDRLVEPEMGADAARAEIHQLAQQLFTGDLLSLSMLGPLGRQDVSDQILEL